MNTNDIDNINDKNKKKMGKRLGIKGFQEIKLVGKDYPLIPTSSPLPYQNWENMSSN